MNRQNARWRWLTAGAVVVSLLAFFLLVGLLMWQSVRAFWPQPLDLYRADSQPPLLGETLSVKKISSELSEAGGAPVGPAIVMTRYLIKTGNRDFAAPDFRLLLADETLTVKRPADAIAIQRRSGGNAYGWFVGLRQHGESLTASNGRLLLQRQLARVHSLQQEARTLRKVKQAKLFARINTLNQQAAEQRQQGIFDLQRESSWRANLQALQRQQAVLSASLQRLEREASGVVMLLRDAQGQQHQIPLVQVVAAWHPNKMTMMEKWQHFYSQLIHYLTDSATAGESGAFPAIFGTVLMVILMSVVVMPLGVIAAVWLHEYAGRNWLTRLVRISVVNPAGVPSIVYGVFGLGFFVWLVGGTLDQLFFAQALPNPTFGTPGLLWASLTLALLTLPVVIVATEEGLSRIPQALRPGSLALGATQAETLWRVTLPLAMPAMLTGLILAIARAAGETAPLMLVGVVKRAPELPLDGIFPRLHPERKFMHLGFQIYDLAWQRPDVEASQPLVYATALLLVIIILSLNLVAMGLRHRLRERFRLLTQ